MPPCVMTLFPNLQPYNSIIYNPNAMRENRQNFNYLYNRYYPYNYNNYYNQNKFNLKGRDMFKIKEHKSCGCGG